MDWSLGRYESTATQLIPAARVVEEQAAPRRDEHVVDIGCGTGNAALLAAERGARVTGVDPAERLLDVARAEAAARSLDATFIRGEAAALPFPDAVADVVLSVFGVIFAPDAPAAAAEMARVTAPHGRIVLSAWRPDGAVAAVMRVRREAIAEAAGTHAAAPPFAWHDGDALARVFGPYGFSVALHEHRLAFTGASPRDFIDAQIHEHPLWVAGRDVLESHGKAQAVRDRALEILEAANEEPGAFRSTSRYIVAIARRQ